MAACEKDEYEGALMAIRGLTASLMGLAGLVAGCDFVDLRPERVAPAEYRKALEPAAAQPAKGASPRFQPPPPEVTDALLPDIGPAATGGARAAPGGRRFDISVMGADAREFFMGLVADSDYNVIVHPDVRGAITIDLKNVTLPEVLDAVREVYGYDYKKTDAGYIVYPAELMSRIYHVDYLNLVRNGRSETRVSAGQSSQLQRGGSNIGSGLNGGGGGAGMLGQSGMGGYGGVGGGYGGGTGSSDSDEFIDCRNASQNTEGQQQSQGSGSSRGGVPFLPGSVVATTSTSHFWRELKQALSVIVCSADGANFVVNQQSGVVVIRAFPKQLREAEQFLDAIRREVKRQVVLEAKILEVVLSDGYQAGVDWATVIRDGQKVMITGLGQPMAALGASRIGQVLTVRMGDFSAIIDLLETQGEVHTLSSPRIATLNNQKAVIKVGTDEFFVTDVTSTTVTGGTNTTTTPSIGLTPFFSGIALDVTPQIDDDGKVTLHVHPSVTEVTDATKTITLNGEQQELPLPVSKVRESDSVVHAENGQIVVIGGLMQNVEKNAREGVAWLSRIPGVGSLFRRGKGDFIKSELVILLKPILIEDDKDWQAVHRDAVDRPLRLEGESRREILP